MRYFVRNTLHAISIDWAVFMIALLGLGVAITSLLETNPLARGQGLFDRAPQSQAPIAIAEPKSSEHHGQLVDLGAVTVVEEDAGGTWAYNDQMQLVSPDTGALLPIYGATHPSGTGMQYYNQRGEVVDQNGVLIRP